MSLPTSLAEFTVQLLFSDGGAPQYREIFWEFYAIAMTPFVLGIPSDQVELIIADQLRGFSSKVIQQENDDIMVDDAEIMPAGYKAYFESVYRNAKTTSIEDGLAAPLRLNPCSLRVIAGHGYGNFGRGKISVGGRTIRYPDLGANATCLTILDICNAVYTVAHLEGKIPGKNKWHRFNKAALFEGESKVPVICDKNDALWAFRVGYEGQHADLQEQKCSNGRMSKPIGDSIAASLLFSIKLLKESGGENTTLDEIFHRTYTSLKIDFLPEGVDRPNPHSSLGTLQSAIEDGIAPVNMKAFDCPFFRLQAEWFLTMERVLALTNEDDGVANEIITVVVDSIVAWYARHDEKSWYDDEFPTEWRKLVNLMGPFRGKLTSIKLVATDDGRIVGAKKEGLSLEAWGLSCGGLPEKSF